ncbi:MAG: nuclear transport factor 2 family protein [Lachnospiraceae bacterium]|jgi:ketosteroid isomerase-like protein|nr:nuclear transport factor 2 family protein [Lachnospiraceae bacterium]
MNDKEQIEALYRTYWKYMIEKNTEGMRRIMTEDYVLMHMTGLRQKREDFFRSVKSGELNYYSAVHDGIDVSVTGDRARMTGKSRVSAAVYGGGRHTWRLQGDFCLRKEDGLWKLSSSRASTY